ncbi:hypothetical protein SBI63_00615 [Mycolicibacterium sp. 120270]|nr:hypothetical protein [Mycolicibacterium sp. 120270]MDX1881853.1 hypothetical protein [Mycolicibacterium sp. 120270]
MPYPACFGASEDSAMSDIRESAAERHAVTTPPYDDVRHRPNSILVWVGIVAGVVFIVAVVFFAGFFIGRSSAGGWRGGYQQPGMMWPSQSGPYGQWGPGMMGPGGMMGPNYQWPGQQPTTTAPSTPRP